MSALLSAVVWFWHPLLTQGLRHSLAWGQAPAFRINPSWCPTSLNESMLFRTAAPTPHPQEFPEAPWLSYTSQAHPCFDPRKVGGWAPGLGGAWSRAGLPRWLPPGLVHLQLGFFVSQLHNTSSSHP